MPKQYKYLPHQAQAKSDLRWKQSHRRPRPIQSTDVGPVASKPVLGGLHHRYYREAA